MSYSSNAGLPYAVKKGLPVVAQTVWRRVYNEYCNLGQEQARQVAWSAVEAGWQKEGDSWVKKDWNELLVPLNKSTALRIKTDGFPEYFQKLLGSQPGTYAAFRLEEKSAKALAQWAKDVGIPNPVPADELHVTVFASETPVPAYEAEASMVDYRGTTNYLGPGYTISHLGPEGNALVLEIPEPVGNSHVMEYPAGGYFLLRSRREYAEALGARCKYPFRPHITLSYDAAEFHPTEPPPFAVYLGKEYVEIFKESDDVKKQGEGVSDNDIEDLFVNISALAIGKGLDPKQAAKLAWQTVDRHFDVTADGWVRRTGTPTIDVFIGREKFAFVEGEGEGEKEEGEEAGEESGEEDQSKAIGKASSGHWRYQPRDSAGRWVQMQGFLNSLGEANAAQLRSVFRRQTKEVRQKITRAPGRAEARQQRREQAEQRRQAEQETPEVSQAKAKLKEAQDKLGAAERRFEEARRNGEDSELDRLWEDRGRALREVRRSEAEVESAKRLPEVNRIMAEAKKPGSSLHHLNTDKLESSSWTKTDMFAGELSKGFTTRGKNMLIETKNSIPIEDQALIVNTKSAHFIAIDNLGKHDSEYGQLESQIAGFYASDQNKIVLNERSDPQSLTKTMRHEIGHAVDWSLGRLEQRESLMRKHLLAGNSPESFSYTPSTDVKPASTTYKIKNSGKTFKDIWEGERSKLLDRAKTDTFVAKLMNDTKYYTDNNEKEMFAELYQLSRSANTSVPMFKGFSWRGYSGETIKEYFPESVSAFNEIMTENGLRGLD